MDFCAHVKATLERGGKVLIPCYSIGRAQEIAVLLEQYWNAVGVAFPLVFSASAAEEANAYYRLFVQWTSASLASGESAFVFPHSRPYSPAMLQSADPLILFASPGMLHTGFSLRVFQQWAPDAKNLVVVPGYAPKGTVGNLILQGKKEVDIGKHTVHVRCDVRYFPLSAHVDSKGICQLAARTNPRDVVLVHGEVEKMGHLAETLRRLFDVWVH